ncbi:cell division protein ZapE [Pseudarthrobacter oxydans]|uniref:Cell division protein ZapE n=1 Tax=Pseudarthrobacter oxydans TaxID=1671 RepID=A0AAW8N601_PSEOX|nr:hypothetical protein [Pseudarthrobacter oxydans]MDR6792533.1 cell division protein ZapE [Pseudarthrobacter oxydans]MDR7162264.1 cell division protein ZapE [Pseudarthrobacter oxydans]
MAAEPEPPALPEGRILVPGSSRQLAVYGLFPPPPGRHRTVTAGSRVFAAKACEPELLWISFDELCAPGTSREDYSLLPAGAELWVIDGVPVPEPSDAGPRAEAWDLFAAALAAAAARGTTLFVVGAAPMDWAAASRSADDPGLRSALAETSRLLAGLKRVESDETVAMEGVSGS